MTRARDNADLGDSYGSLAAGVTGGSGLNAVSPANLASGVLPVGVTGGSGLTALGTVTSGNLSNTAIVYPAGHIIQTIIGSRTSAITISNTDYQSVGISATITPLYSNSKMLITLWGTTRLDNSSNNTGQDHKITRVAGTSESVSGSIVFSAGWMNYFNRTNAALNDHYPPMHVTYVDSGFPNEQITYGMFARKYGGQTASQNWTFGEGNGGTTGGMLMIQEIKQ